MIVLRKAEIEDVPAIKEIEVENNLASWSFADYRAELERGDSIFYVAEIRKQSTETIAGFVLARLITNNHIQVQAGANVRSATGNPVTSNDASGSEKNEKEKSKIEHSADVEIYNIAVRENFRRLKVGSDLLNEILSAARERENAALWLEVRASNRPAVEFYRSFGFKTICRRKNFYHHPIEDALVLNLEI